MTRSWPLMGGRWMEYIPGTPERGTQERAPFLVMPIEDVSSGRRSSGAARGTVGREVEGGRGVTSVRRDVCRESSAQSRPAKTVVTGVEMFRKDAEPVRGRAKNRGYSLRARHTKRREGWRSARQVYGARLGVHDHPRTPRLFSAGLHPDQGGGRRAGANARFSGRLPAPPQFLFPYDRCDRHCASTRRPLWMVMQGETSR